MITLTCPAGNSAETFSRMTFGAASPRRMIDRRETVSCRFLTETSTGRRDGLRSSIDASSCDTFFSCSASGFFAT